MSTLIAVRPAIGLADASLDQLADKHVPGYDRKKVKAGIVHISVGNFHRSHQALYVDRALASGENEWGICGVSARNEDRKLYDALSAQDGLYCLLERQNETQNLRVIGSLISLLFAPDNHEAVFKQLSAPETKIVSLTVTERGYCHDPATGKLNRNRPEIINDLQNPLQPQSVLGYIVEGLARRKQAGLKPFTVLSCDNLPSNGETVKNVILELAGSRSSDLARWIEDNGSFPNTMVDRITPATQPGDSTLIEKEFSIKDSAPVICEPFLQWILEDKFCQGRPAWEKSGALFVDDVHPYELSKIRLLNVTHSALAYPGLLAGLTYVHEATRDTDIRPFLKSMMDEEISPTLPAIPGFDFAQYKATLIERFSNAAILDRLERICMDGSQKLSNQLFPIIRERIAAGKNFKRAAYTVAAWVRYLSGVTDDGQTFKVADPLAERLSTIAIKAKDDLAPYLAVSEVFPVDLKQNDLFVSEVSEALRAIYALGARQALKNLDETLA